MSKKLVLVESPAKAKTINKYLGKNFIVEATVGHIKNLPKSKLGVDVDNGFEPQFVTIRGKGETLKKIRDLSAKCDSIYIATDPDREGEAIAQDIAEIVQAKKNNKIFRVLFNEITKNGVIHGMNNPREIDERLVNSQRARRVMDRIIGYKMSPFLWKVVLSDAGSSLSAGRVQSVALRIICEREDEIERFKETEYWSIVGTFQTENKSTFNAKLYSIANKEIKTPHKPNMTPEEEAKFFEHHVWIRNEKEAKEIESRILGLREFRIVNIVKKNTKRNPSPPFITSTLQAEASKALRFRSRQTMAIAQKLYEGVDLGAEGTAGLITYMRTDSTRVSKEIVEDARDFIKTSFGNEYLPESPNYYDKKKGANVQDAHEAIRPTSMKYTPEFVKPFLDNNSYKLYLLIWQRFLASQMTSALMQTTVIEIGSAEFIFRAYGQAMLFDGFMKLYVEEEEQNPNKLEEKVEAKNEKIPVGLEKNDLLSLLNLERHQHFTKAPPRFSESTLIKELENKGIGRPSTYALIVSTILDRKYATLEDRRLCPTKLGRKVNSILIENFPDIIDVGFTAKMEAELDQIAQGDNQYLNVLNDFYVPFSMALSHVEDKIEKILCENCGAEMVIRFGRFGKFLACTNYPECKNIKSFKELAQLSSEPEYTGENCEKCGAKTVFRNGKFGKFIGCERYPDCDFIKNITLGIKCPKCKEGNVIERLTKRKKTFFGCDRYPDCDFISWNKPVYYECPNGDSPYMEEKYSKKKGKYLKCPVCAEEVTEEIVSEEEE